MKRLLLLFAIPLFSLLMAASSLKKNVLIIGDSISAGYRPFVVEALADVATVVRQEGNAKMSANGVEYIDSWLGDTKWDVIHFNFGLWDLCYRHPESKVQGNRDKVNGTLTATVEEYAENLEIIVERLEKTGAKLIFATTTYVPTEEEGRFVEDAQRYNAVATEIMKRHKIKINPLYDLSVKVHPKDGKANNDVHYEAEGYEALSKQVAKYIRREL